MKLKLLKIIQFLVRSVISFSAKMALFTIYAFE